MFRLSPSLSVEGAVLSAQGKKSDSIDKSRGLARLYGLFGAELQLQDNKFAQNAIFVQKNFN